jgi:hypothetical protein
MKEFFFFFQQVTVGAMSGAPKRSSTILTLTTAQDAPAPPPESSLAAFDAKSHVQQQQHAGRVPVAPPSLVASAIAGITAGAGKKKKEYRI